MLTIRLAAAIALCLTLAAAACSSAENAPAVEPTSSSASATVQATATAAPTTAPAPPQPTPTPLPVTASATATVAPPPSPTAVSAASEPSEQSGASSVSDSAPPETVERDLRIVTLLPYDAIPAILRPEFVSAEDADAELDPESLVIGLSIDGDHRAYSIPTLSSYEIVNDTVGGAPVAVTW